MPDNISEFEAKGTITPSDRGIQAAAQAGWRIGRFYNQMGQDIGRDVSQIGGAVQEHQTNMEVMNLYKTGTDLQNNLSQAWQTFSADPANKGRPDLANAFMEQHVKPTLAEWSSHAQTDKGKMIATEMGDRITGEMFRRTAADQSGIDANHAEENLTGTINGFGAQIVNDPSSFDRVVGASDTAIENMIPTTVEPGTRATMIRELKQHAHEQFSAAYFQTAAAVGAEQVAQTGSSAALDQARKDYASGKFQGLMSPEAYANVPEVLDRAERAGMADAARVQESKDRQQREASKERAGNYLTVLGNSDPSQPGFTADWNRKVLTDPTLEPDTRDSLVSMGQRLANETRETASRGNPELLHSFITRMGNGGGVHEKDIIDTVGIPNGLSQSEADFALKVLKGDPNGTQAKMDTKQLDAEMGMWKTKTSGFKITGMPDKAGSEAYTDAVNFYTPMISTGRANGIPMSDLLGPPDAAHPNSIYHTRTIESFAPGSHTKPTDPNHVQSPNAGNSSVLDAVTGVWRDLTKPEAGASANGGTSVRMPIEKPAPSTTTIDPANLAKLNKIFAGQ